MSAHETLNRWVEAMQILCGHDDNPGPEGRARYEETRRKFLDGYRAEVLAEAKVEVVAWLVKKAREGEDIGRLASKVDRGAVRCFLGTPHYWDALDAHRAEVLAEVGEAWPGELDHLRSLARTLTPVAEAGDLTAVQRQLAAHQRIDTRRRTEAYAANGGGR